MPKIDCLTAKITVHIPVDAGDPVSVTAAANNAQGLLRKAYDIGQATIETRFNRVDAPPTEPEPEPKVEDKTDPHAPESTATEPASEEERDPHAVPRELQRAAS